ncbi:N-acetyltransferase [bacterium]|nr:N-acetyltransferase [bacterium]
MDYRNAPLDPHIRAIDLKKDLSKIADLVDISFSDHMDAEGMDYLHHMRQTAKSALYLQYAGTSPENSSYPFHGYVWEEKGNVIGNLTLIYLRRKAKRVYFIANVAVHPDYRGRGIAHQLTERALRHVAEHQGSTVYLQVRDDNPTAMHIYQAAGFDEIAHRTTWMFDGSLATRNHATASAKVSIPRHEDWEQQKTWLCDIYPPSISWNLSFHLNTLEPGFYSWVHRLLNGNQVRHWAIHSENRLHGVLSWEKGPFQSDSLWLATSPLWEEEIIATLIPTAFHAISKPMRVNLNYPAARAVDAFHQAGMKEHLTLVWMKKTLTPSSPMQSA